MGVLQEVARELAAASEAVPLVAMSMMAPAAAVAAAPPEPDVEEAVAGLLFMHQMTPSMHPGRSPTQASSPRSASEDLPFFEDEAEETASDRSPPPAGAEPQARVCGMRHCTTHGKRRRGVPYCGTCRKFIEETVRWYIDHFGHHPATNLDNFLRQVSSVRLGCGQRSTKGTKCSCKMCRSYVRFNELMIVCKDHLNVFLRFKFRSDTMPHDDDDDAAALGSPADAMTDPDPADAAAADPRAPAERADAAATAAARLAHILDLLHESAALLPRVQPAARAAFALQLQSAVAAIHASG